MKKYTSSLLFFSMFVMFLFAFQYITFADTTTPGALKVHYIEVGQADSILVELPNNEVMLIDTATDALGKKVVDYIKSQNISKIDYLVGTHPHEDHIGGIDKVINSFKIGKVYVPDLYLNTKECNEMVKAISKNKIPKVIAKAGLNLVHTNDLDVSMVAPCSSKYKSENDYSAVIRITYKNSSFLFMADAEKVSERELLDSDVNIKSDVLKVGHHGDNTSSSYEFIKRVDPKYAIITCEKYSIWDNPKKSILDLLYSFNIKTYRTDVFGTVVVSTDGTNYSVSETRKEINPDLVVKITNKKVDKDNTIKNTKLRVLKNDIKFDYKPLFTLNN